MSLTKGLVYYTDNTPAENIFLTCQKKINRCMDIWNFPIYSVSHKPIDFGINIVMPLERSVLSMFKQMLKGIEECKTDLIFLIEHDIVYHPSHFAYVPERKDIFYYNRNMWHVSSVNGKAVYYLHNDPSHLVAYRDLLLRHYTKVVETVEKHGYHSGWGFSPPKGLPPEMREGKYISFMAEQPNIDIRHEAAFTRQRMDKSQFRNERSCREWTESDRVPYWGITQDRFNEFMKEVYDA